MISSKKTNKMTYKEVFGNMTCQDIYFDWVNNWLSIDAMASSYGTDVDFLQSAIDSGRKASIEEYNWRKKAESFINSGYYY